MTDTREHANTPPAGNPGGDSTEWTNREELIAFYRDHLYHLERGTLTSTQLDMTRQFYMEFLMTHNPTAFSSDRDLLRFMTLGWYIYTYVIGDNATSVFHPEAALDDRELTQASNWASSTLANEH